MPDPPRSALQEERAGLQSRLDTLNQRTDKFNVDCNSVEASQAETCREEQKNIRSEKTALLGAIDKFKKELARLQSPAEILKRERQHIEPGLIERAEHVNPVTKAFREFLSENQDAFFERHYGFVNNPALQSRLTGLINKLRNVSPYSDEPITTKVLDHPKYPKQTQTVGEEIVYLGADRNVQIVGNTIYVGRSYLERNPPPSDDEILFVLGHEVGHLDRNHQTEKAREIITERLKSLPGEMLSPDQTTLSPKQRAFIRDQTMKAQWLADYTKVQESEADRDGAYLALAAGAKPQGMRQAFAWMQNEETAHPPPTAAEKKRNELTRDHPEPEERFKALQHIYGSPLGKL